MTTHRRARAPQDNNGQPRNGQRQDSARRGNRRANNVDERCPTDEAPTQANQSPLPALDAKPNPGQTPARRSNPPAPPAKQLTLREARPPVDQRDFADRHDTRATSDNETLKRYMDLEWHRTRCEWHRTLQRLATIGVCMIFYVAALVALYHLIPNITIKQAMLAAGAALAGSAGGYGLFVAGQALRRYRRRDSGNDPSP